MNSFAIQIIVADSLGEMRQICEKYEVADSDEKLYLEKRYGKKVIAVAIQESQTHEWMQQNSRSCPSCQANIEVCFTFVANIGYFLLSVALVSRTHIPAVLSRLLLTIAELNST